MANEFKIKNGLVVDAGGINTTGSVNVSGSLSVGTGGITEFQVVAVGTIIGNSITDVHAITGSVQISGSLNATASNAVSASYALTALSASFATLSQTSNTASYVVTAQTASYVVTSQTASYVAGTVHTVTNPATFATTASYVLQAVSSSFATLAQTSNTASYVLNAVSASYATSALTASHALTSPYSGLQGTVPTWNQNTTGTAATASYVAGANVAGNIAGNAATSTSASYAATASFANSFTVAGTLTAQTINVQTITSSIEFNTGSTRNGSLTTNTHEFTGSILANSTNTNAFSVNTNTIYVSSSNNVGIGLLPSNTYKLEVSGSIGAVAYYETSDIRLKNVIETNPSINLSSIDVIKYNLYGSQDVHYGYSAQQVQSVCSDLVKGGEYLSLNYTDLHTLKILQLEQKIAQLEAQLSK